MIIHKDILYFGFPTGEIGYFNRKLKTCAYYNVPATSFYVCYICLLNTKDIYSVHYKNRGLMKMILNLNIEKKEATKALRYNPVFAFPEMVQYLINSGGVLLKGKLSNAIKQAEFCIKRGYSYPSRQTVDFLKNKFKELYNDNG